MAWEVEFYSVFAEEFKELSETVQDELYIEIGVLEKFGPNLGRPQVDTLYDSEHSNMKEIRFNADGGVWRTAFAFDPERKAILLITGNKAGINQKRFYKKLIKQADQRFNDHLRQLKEKKS